MTISTQHAEEALGNKLTFVRSEDGTVYVPLKRLCEFLRIDYEKQRSKVRNRKALNAELVSVPGTDGRHRKMICLPLEAVGAWASTIDPYSVQPEVVEALMSCLEKSDQGPEGNENHKTDAAPGTTEITPEENRKEQVYNCLGNLNWFLDALLLWASEVADNNGDYFPGNEIAKASPEEVREFVRKVRFNIRVLQAIIDASIQYENLDNPLDKHELIEFYNESLKFYRSTDELIDGFAGGRTGLQNPGHSYLDYLCGPGLNAMTEFGGEIIMNFHEKIIPRKKG